jgi:hypothetical protein
MAKGDDMTRTHAILQAVISAVDRRRAQIDQASDLRGLAINIAITPEHLQPKAVSCRLEFETKKERRS